MAVFAILSDKPQPDLRASIEKEFPESYYHWADTVSFVTSSGTAKSVAVKLGIKTRGPAGEVTGTIGSAIVTMLSPSYFGWSKATLWDWLKTGFEAAD